MRGFTTPSTCTASIFSLCSFASVVSSPINKLLRFLEDILHRVSRLRSFILFMASSRCSLVMRCSAWLISFNIDIQKPPLTININYLPLWCVVIGLLFYLFLIITRTYRIMKTSIFTTKKSRVNNSLFSEGRNIHRGSDGAILIANLKITAIKKSTHTT